MTVPTRSRILSHVERQANGTSHGSSFVARHGFSVIELLIVIAVLTMVAAFVLPELRHPLDRSRLRSGAVDVQSAWGKARSFAIREGVSMTFRCRLGGRHWKIERDGKTAEMTFPSDEETPFVFRADNDQGSSQQEFDTRRQEKLVREGWLPEGVTFADLRLSNLTRQRQDQFNSRSEDEQPQQWAESQWSEPLTFRPEGHSGDAQLRIKGASNFVVHVKIRGLTSSVSFTAPFQHKQSGVHSGGRS